MERIKEFMTAFKKAAHLNRAKWVEWIHEQKGKTHCDTCLKLDKCWFLEDNKPKLPQHFFCHCRTIPLDYSRVVTEARAASDSRKFDPYLFNRDLAYPHNKQKLFESWGYTIDDAPWLQKTVAEQCQEKYINGDYTLGKLNENGQRISIRIEIPRKDKEGTVSFLTGWMVYPNGHIQLNTPYGGK